MDIKVLPSDIANQIAAGEVVERPASVIKECVENSLDARAQNIEIHIEDGGKKLIKIIDNGSGMSAENAKRCHLRHATSKIQNIEDLFSVQSFGFRGEALAAISAVSGFQLITKRDIDDIGIKISIKAGKDIQESPFPSNTGTTIIINNLFYPTPARLAHLKQNATEIREISREIKAFALANPRVSFKFYKEQKLSLDLPATDSISRVATILKESSADLAEVFFQSNTINISGYSIKPGKCVGSKTHQYLFVNKRRVEDYKLAYALREAYVQSAGIEHHLHPKFALFINIEPIMVDVNVHPRKLEVKFAEPGDIFRAVKHASISALESIADSGFAGGLTRLAQNKSYNAGNSARFTPNYQSNTSVANFSQDLLKNDGGFSALNNERLLFKTDFGENSLNSNSTNETPTGELKLVGQIARKYIMAEAENGVWMFDQHALHERQRFEEFWQDRAKLTTEIQKLLLPYQLKIEIEDWEKIWENREELNNLGFSFNENKEVQSLPKILVDENLDQIFAGFSDFFSNHKVGENYIDTFLRKMLEYKSCRGAVMFGDKMERAEMQLLLDDFQTTQWRNLCPHGRPNHIFWSFGDLDRQFHR